MSESTSYGQPCALCGQGEILTPVDDETALCPECHERSESLFEEELRKVELIRTIRGTDVEVYEIKHPISIAEKNHCGQVILIRAGEGFEVKICLRSDVMDWMTKLNDPVDGFTSKDNRLDALIGNIFLLIDSWGGGPHYMDIFYVDHVISTDGEI